MLDGIQSEGQQLSVERILALTLDESGCVLLSGKYWHGLYKLLPAAPDGEEPPRPLILGGDIAGDDEGKRNRMREHIEWAERYGVLDRVYRYILRFLETESKEKR